MGYSAAPFDMAAAFRNRNRLMDDRRKRLKFRVWRRGFREIDLILGGFADAHAAEMDEARLSAFEALLLVPDNDVYDWITGAAPAPPEYDTPILAQIRAFRLDRTKTDPKTEP